MIKRTCPNCYKEWYSSQEHTEWICNKCGFILTPKLNKGVLEEKQKVYRKEYRK